MFGLRVISVSGSAEFATMPFTPPFVRSQSSSRLPTPVLTTSTLPASSASVCAPPPERFAHVTLRLGTPRFAASFSIRCCFSITCDGRYKMPGWRVIDISVFCCASAANDEAATTQAASVGRMRRMRFKRTSGKGDHSDRGTGQGIERRRQASRRRGGSCGRGTHFRTSRNFYPAPVSVAWACARNSLIELTTGRHAACTSVGLRQRRAVDHHRPGVDCVPPSSANAASPVRSRTTTVDIPRDADDCMLTVDDKALRLTNLRKPFWRALGVTKGDLLRYYAAVAPALLPHVAGRAMVMKRYPNGADGECFFMKRAPRPRPEWIATCAIEHGSGSVIAFPVVDDLASLLWLVNL